MQNSVKKKYIPSFFTLSNWDAASLLVHFRVKKVVEVSISPTFSEQLVRWYSCAKKYEPKFYVQKWIWAKLWYKKAARKMLVKLTGGRKLVKKIGEKKSITTSLLLRLWGVRIEEDGEGKTNMLQKVYREQTFRRMRRSSINDVMQFW
jgi:hypothetical protein